MNTRPMSRLRTFLLQIFLPYACLLASFLLFSTALADEQPPEIDAPPKAPLAAESAGERWQNIPLSLRQKIDPRIIAELNGEIIPVHLGGSHDPVAILQSDRNPIEQTRFLVHMRSPDLLAQALHRAQKERAADQIDQRTAIFQMLVHGTEAAQASVRTLLEAERAEANVSTYQSFFIINAIAVDGNLSTLLQLALRDDVVRISANYPLVSIDEVGESGVTAAEDVQTRELQEAQQLSPQNWNIDLVDADRVWNELGVRGEGAVVSNFDTGVYFQHPALVNQYRGKSGNQFNHNYNWFEPDSKLYPDGNLGPSVSIQPYDCANYSFHGTHTMGTMVGDGGTSGQQIGMAPKAQWISVPGICYNTMSGGIRDDIGGLKAFQWLLCPTDLTGDLATADCSKAPDVVNNSWGSANPTNDLFRPAIQALRAAGVAPVFSAGNPYAGPGSIGSPASAPEAITVGATDVDDNIAPFSGLGPSFYEGELKPELSAPGVDVVSSVDSSYYYDYSGTSMAAPHVAGLIALMVSADLQDGSRDFNVDELERFMQETAVDLGEPGHDNSYGYGRIDAYQAVRWVLSAGDLQGLVIDSRSGLAIADATVTGGRDAQNSFQGQTTATGHYSLTVPAGSYDISIDAWGYEAGLFERQTVFGSLLSVANFSLRPLPLATLQGRLLDEAGMGVGDGSISVIGHESTQIQTAADGAYTLTLPIGTHQLLVQRTGYRVAQVEVTIQEEEGKALHQDITLTAAPTILLVDSDAHYGHFDGWPVYNVFRWALDRESYLYDFWRIQYPDVTDTGILDSGETSYGVPSVETLNQYDLVLWIHSGCRRGFYGCIGGGSPTDIGADDELSGYLDDGGRLILSGQDIGYWDRNEDFFQNYLHATYELDSAAAAGDTVSGIGFLEELNLKITNATLYGYRNGIMRLLPDAVSSDEGDGSAYPILTYDNGNGTAALAVSPCTEAYRGVYFALGYENLGPRADDRDPAVATVLDRSIVWAMQEKLDYEISLSGDTWTEVDSPGRRVTYPLEVINTGRLPVHLELKGEGNLWPTQILSGTTEITEPISLAPCRRTRLTVQVDIPEDAENGDSDLLTILIDAPETDTLADSREIRTRAFHPWTIEPSQPNGYRYDVGVAALPNDPYIHLFGGWIYSDSATRLHERYDFCTGEWSTMASMPARRAGIGSATLNGKFYAVGGRTIEYANATSGYEIVYYKSLYIYDPATDSWSAGADLPIPLSGFGTAVVQGKLYIIGGVNSDGISDRTFEYDPISDRWAGRAAMPDEGRRYISAATLNDKIYVAGGYPNLKVVEIYDPITDAWSTAGSLNIGRWGAGMTAAPDGFLYITGGASQSNDLASAERYDPETEMWHEIASLNDENRLGSAALYAAGRVLTVGGFAAYNRIESLKIANSFCYSNKSASHSLVQPGDVVTYTVALFPDEAPLPDVQFSDAIPSFTSFKGFGLNEIGVVYDEENRRLFWRGELLPSVEPIRFTYQLEIHDTRRFDLVLPEDEIVEYWGSGDQIQNIATFSTTFGSGATVSFSDAIINTVLVPDLSPSVKSAQQGLLDNKAAITYTIALHSTSFAGGKVKIQDPLPGELRYVPDSLVYPNGVGRYNPETHSIDWSGLVATAPDAYINTSNNYLWIDSEGAVSAGIDEQIDGALDEMRPDFDWIDIQEIGTYITNGDDIYTCLDIGFPFQFYNRTENRFCVDTNGFISFDEALGYSDYTNDCPLPSIRSNDALIAAVWDDFVVQDGIYYQAFGTAPNRYLVVQWVDVVPYYSFSSNEPANFEIILYESGEIKIQILDAGNGEGRYSTTGVEDHSGGKGVTYACKTDNSLADKTAIRFIPPGSGQNAHADIRFAMTVDNAVGADAIFTNTVVITSIQQTLTRSVTTGINALDLSQSTVSVDRTEAIPNERVRYHFTLRNTGLLPADGSHFSGVIPLGTEYVPASLSCEGAPCVNPPTIDESGHITWIGTIGAKQSLTLSYDVVVSALLPNGATVSNEGLLRDGEGHEYPLKASLVVKRSDLGISFMQAQPTHVEPGRETIYTIFVRNSGHLSATGAVEVQLHPALTYADGAVTCGSGSCRHDSGTIRWSGIVGARNVIPIIFRAQVPDDANYGDTFISRAKLVEEAWSIEHDLDAAITVARDFYLPILFVPEHRPREVYLPMVAR